MRCKNCNRHMTILKETYINSSVFTYYYCVKCGYKEISQDVTEELR